MGCTSPDCWWEPAAWGVPVFKESGHTPQDHSHNTAAQFNLDAVDAQNALEANSEVQIAAPQVLPLVLVAPPLQHCSRTMSALLMACSRQALASCSSQVLPAAGHAAGELGRCAFSSAATTSTGESPQQGQLCGKYDRRTVKGKVRAGTGGGQRPPSALACMHGTLQHAAQQQACR